MDKVSQEVLKQLIKNPKNPFLKIAEELGVSPITIKNRYEKMKKDGVIFGTTIMLDISKIGFQGKAFLHITTSEDQNPEMTIKALRQIPNIFLVSEIIGTFDILAMVAFRDVKEIKEVINRIRAEPSVEKVESSITDDTFYPVAKEYANIRLF